MSEAKPRGACSKCDRQLSLNSDGTLIRHRAPRGNRRDGLTCPGSGKPPKAEEEPRLGMCDCCDRQVRVDDRGFPHRHLGPAGFCKGEDFKAKEDAS